ncbi:MAG: asparagine synthase (glutamine-hydrolyzing) [Cyclobacteriaceae bacterium]|jgi:asparagine synthase (glutamine-hydrolysing)
MCGITGIFAYNLVGKFNKVNVAAATRALEKRGPDFQDVFLSEWVCLGHRRLSIIDTREVAHQPMWDSSGRYGIVFNGEIFNYRELRQNLEQRGFTFRTESDTEVLLNLWIANREACLNQLNGFFAFCIYDQHEESLFLARDRYGIKPLLYLSDDDKFIFASEMKSIVHYGIDKSLDYTALATYFQLNYIPAPRTVFSAVKKLLPGHYIRVKRGDVSINRYYSIPYPTAHPEPLTYEEAQQALFQKLEASVQKRLVADVPLGAFLSGGIDSSVITGLASRHKPNLHTFSIGFRDQKFFDETEYARKVARHFGTEHTVFSLTTKDLYAQLNSVLDYLDEPFADSSAVNVYILSQQTRRHATVALSGDGADEVFGGYNKHLAFARAMQGGWKESLAAALKPAWQLLPKSRHAPFSNTVRQLLRYAEGHGMTARNRYWHWASLATLPQAQRLFTAEARQNIDLAQYEEFRQSFLEPIGEPQNLNDILLADCKLVLPNDMLTKVDLMSMANGLEVRVPFLDFEVVNFAFGLPAEYKINRGMRKRLVQDAFRSLLPAELYNRPKKGFEAPVLAWMRHELKDTIKKDLLSEEFIYAQGLFDYAEIKKLKRQLFSISPGDIHARVWALVVFQWWWKKYGVSS